MPTNLIPAVTGNSRIFIIEGRARADHEPSFESCLMAGSLDQSFGDIERIECPSPDEYGKFDEIGSIKGAVERASMSLTGRYALDLQSTLLRLARRGCPNDVQVHFGSCTDPSDFDEFTKAMILEDAFLTNYSTEDLGALGSDEQAKIDESSDVSARSVYEVLQLSLAARGADVVTNPLNDVVICSNPSCGDCDDEDDGCEIIYAVGDSSPGSPGTAPDVIYSTDKGVTLAADEITTMDNTQNADALACIKTWVVVVSNDSGSLHYKLITILNAGTGAGWTEVTTGFSAGGEPNDIWSVGNFGFIVGDGGYVYGTSNPTTGVTVLDAGVATDQNLSAVHAISSNFAVAVGASGVVIFTENQTTWAAATVVTGTPNLSAVWIKNTREWWVGTTAGAVWYTLDGGSTWTQFTGFPVTLTAVNDIAFSTNSIGYISGHTAGTAGVILRTYNGGNTWVVLPEGVGNIPASDSIYAVAACTDDPNFVVGVGLADDALDGIYIVGQD